MFLPDHSIKGKSLLLRESPIEISDFSECFEIYVGDQHQVADWLVQCVACERKTCFMA
jgi:hypothetical protein